MAHCVILAICAYKRKVAERGKRDRVRAVLQ